MPRDYDNKDVNDYDFDPDDDKEPYGGRARWVSSDKYTSQDSHYAIMAETHNPDPHKFAIWAHLNHLSNYAPVLRDEHRKPLMKHLSEGITAIGKSQRAVTADKQIEHATKALGSLGMATNILVKQLGPNHPWSQEALANHAGAIASHAAIVEKAAK